MADDAPRLCRHVHSDGVRLCLRYTMSDGRYVGEIDMAAGGGVDVWQMLAYDLLAVTTAVVAGRPAPEADRNPREAAVQPS